MQLITISDLQKILRRVGIAPFFQQLINALEKEFARWAAFQKSPRHTWHLQKYAGVIELMPICDDEYYACKYVNGHPNNPALNKLTVVALGLLAEMKTGYPVLISEMTLLTALRTAATSALASKYLARKNAKTFGIIGTGAQAEFQVLAHKAIFDIDCVKYFDIDKNAMEKFSHNLQNQSFTLIPCDDAQSVFKNVDILTTATAAKKQAEIVKRDALFPGLHLNAIGGDCPGKTELDPHILSCVKIVVEYLLQSKTEGEIQQSDAPIYAELWELAAGVKKGRTSNDEITLFDSVGFALEDFTILKLIYQLAAENNIGQSVALIPELPNPKNLFGLLTD